MPLGAARLAFLAKVTTEAEVIRRKVGVTAVGNAQISTAESKFGGSSALFDGNGDYLLVPYSENWDLTSDKQTTIELFFRSADTTVTEILTTKRDSGTDSGWQLISQNNEVVFTAWTGSGNVIELNGGSINSNIWHHLALVQDFANVTIYIDGTSVANGNYSTSPATNSLDLAIGKWLSNPNFEYTGNMDEFRISNTARYTTNFTPQTEPHVNDANTLLLLHCDGTDGDTVFEDDNGVDRSQKDIRGINSAHIETTQSKFGGSSLELTHSTDDYLLTEADSDIKLHGTGDFTIETWVYTKNNNHAAACFFTQIFSNNQVPIWFGLASGVGAGRNSGGNKVCAESYNGGWTSLVESTTTLSNNTWYHIALVRSSGTLTLYINGTSEDTATFTTTPSTNQSDIRIGRRWDTYSTSADISLDAYLDEYRISNTARYTANFTAPTEPHVNDANTLLLLHCDGTDGDTYFPDDNGVRQKAGVTSVNGTAISTTESQFGGSSAEFTAANNTFLDVLYQPGFPDNFTIEWFVYFKTLPSINGFYMFQGGKVLGQNTYIGIKNLGSGQFDLEFAASNGASQTFRGYEFDNAVTGEWFHIAAQKNGSTPEVYIDGIQKTLRKTGGASFGSGYGLTPPETLLGRYYNGLHLDGYMDEYRVSNIARYNANFTPQTEPFQNDDNTLLLLHMDGTDGSTVFIDDNGVTPNQDYS